MRTVGLFAVMAALVAVGTPMVWYLWEVLNELLSGRVEALHAALALPIFLVFVLFLAFVSRALRRMERGGAK